ncbi:hypothetical protein DV736_g6092, partial [Chaetothyriales sp. CBS 134916]
MAELDTLDLVVLLALLLASLAYFTKGTFWGKPSDPYAHSAANGSLGKNQTSRSIVDKLEETGKNCVIFFGSQTGTAEDYAQRLAKEGSSRFGLKTMTADLEDYDYETLDQFPEDKIAFFVMATYGEGEPTDNAVEFWEFINSDDIAFSQADDEKPLSKLKYVAFGLGNNTYEHYNYMVRSLDKTLTKLGAERIGTTGEGDDGAGTMEEDFLAWKDPMWAALAERMGLDEREAVYEPVFGIEERDELSSDDAAVYLGEPNRKHLEGNISGPYNAHNPYIAPIAESAELFFVRDRNCVHIEIDVSGSNMTYTTGDHVAVWPTNAGLEVDRFVKTFGLEQKRDKVITLKPLDPTAKIPFPTPTTYDTAIRYHIEICAPVSRQFLATLSAFAPSEAAKKEMARLGSDADYFKDKVASHCLNIAQAVSAVSSEPWSAVPFSCLVEGLNKLQPRYYSISSSSLVQPKKMAITAVVESRRLPGADHVVKGVTTNYLLALKQLQNADTDPSAHGLTYAVDGPRGKYTGIHVPVHVRHSNFKLPSDPSKPIIMVGPGTGVAPFRAFVQERAALAKKGDPVGETVLFYGCRKRSEDWLYRDEWEKYKEALGDKLIIFNAFSREQAEKVYVQHLLKQQSKLVNDLLLKKANFYVCGDAANMARAVNDELIQIVASQRENVDEKRAEQIVKEPQLTLATLYPHAAPIPVFGPSVRSYTSTKPWATPNGVPVARPKPQGKIDPRERTTGLAIIKITQTGAVRTGAVTPSVLLPTNSVPATDVGSKGAAIPQLMDSGTVERISATAKAAICQRGMEKQAFVREKGKEDRCNDHQPRIVALERKIEDLETKERNREEEAAQRAISLEEENATLKTTIAALHDDIRVLQSENASAQTAPQLMVQMVEALAKADISLEHPERESTKAKRNQPVEEAWRPLFAFFKSFRELQTLFMDDPLARELSEMGGRKVPSNITAESQVAMDNSQLKSEGLKNDEIRAASLRGGLAKPSGRSDGRSHPDSGYYSYRR